MSVVNVSKKIEKRSKRKSYLSTAILIFLLILLLFNDDSLSSRALCPSIVYFLVPSCILKQIWKRLLILSEEVFHVKSRYVNYKEVLHICFQDLFDYVTKIALIQLVIVVFFMKTASEGNFILFTPIRRSDIWSLTLFYIWLSVVVACIEMLIGPSNVKNKVLEATPNMAKLWAHSSCTAYYNKVLNDIEERMTLFETEHSMTFPIKKLFLVIPLSCDVRKTFNSRDSNIQYVADLETVPDDQGANINRNYKNPVYKIVQGNREPIYVAMEEPSSLLMFWRLKNTMDRKILLNQRDIYILTLERELKGLPVVILTYDDTKPQELMPLWKFMVRQITWLMDEEDNKCQISMPAI